MCGDGVVNASADESCDDSGESATCDTDCTAAMCGDGVVNASADELCDDGGASATCNADCTPASCGDGVVNASAGEQCDDAGESASCDDNCTIAVCGDGTHNSTAGEQCDDGGESAACDSDCTTATCGDSTVNTTAGEECDDGGSSPNCDFDCTVAVCGDGFVNGAAGEECDDGNANDTDACPSSCLNASCGDGFVYAGVEECDDGNGDDSDLCTTVCENADCTDGILNADEQDVDCAGHCGPASCQVGQVCVDAADCVSNFCDGSVCTYNSKLVFVTSASYNGNMGGLAGADAICQSHADAAGLPGTYLAWLSSTFESPSTRFIQSPGPYTLVDGTVIADNWADLTDGTLRYPIDLSEVAGPGGLSSPGCNSSVKMVWSGTSEWGTTLSNADNRCVDWTSTSGGSQWGNYQVANRNWTTWCSGGTCSWVAPIYCFQQ
jgi:cysteine-rich repeat protein